MTTESGNGSINGLQSQHGKSPYGIIYATQCHLAMAYADDANLATTLAAPSIGTNSRVW